MGGVTAGSAPMAQVIEHKVGHCGQHKQRSCQTPHVQSSRQNREQNPGTKHVTRGETEVSGLDGHRVQDTQNTHDQADVADR
jgi:hypothetical protein